ncbi:MAG TPA: proline racemase family protein, partial [Chitinophagaceae bacterium]|nr:proline racemase family protein [Chitinophagaceae bacterium]
MKAKPITTKFPGQRFRDLNNDVQGAVFDCIDAHTCGNPVRLVACGGPELEGSNMSEKR